MRMQSIGQGRPPISAPLCLLDSSCGAGHGAFLRVSGSDGVDRAARYASSWASVSLGITVARVKGRCEEDGCRGGGKVIQLTPSLLLIFPLTKLPSLCQPFCPLALTSPPRPHWGPPLSRFCHRPPEKPCLPGSSVTCGFVHLVLS